MSIRRMMLFTLGGFFKSIIALFKTRVLSDGGNFEAETNLENQLNTLGSDLFDSASLVITPNAYKEQTLYSIKPTEGYTNLILQSENFAVSPWLALATPNVTRTGNVGTAPDGTNTATLITSNTELASRGIRQNITLFPTQKQYIFSCWVRSDDSAVITIDIGDSGTKTFNLTPTWERVSVLSTPSSSGFVDIAFTSNQLGKTFYIWGGQLEEGTTPGNYIKTTTRPILKGTIGDLAVTRATTATRVNEQGLIEPVPYNLFSYSEDFGNSFWTKNNLTVTTNTNKTMSPIGTNTVDLYVPNTTTGEHQFSQSLTTTGAAIFVTPNNIYNLSIYVKSAGNNYFLLRTRMGGSWSQNIYDLTNGTVVASPNFINADIEDIGNGWYRLSCTFTNIDSPNTIQFVSTPTGNAVFAGDGVSGAYIWGAQLTIGASKREYFATTDRLNVARIDYSTGSPAILVEPQRTNLVYPSDIATTQVIAVTAVAHTLSFYGTGTVTLSGAFSGSLAGTGTNNRVSLTFTPTAGNLTLTVNGSVTNWQLEARSNTTSYIPTVSGSVTRNADIITLSGLFTKNIVTSTGGSWYVELINEKPLIRTNSSHTFYIGDSTSGNVGNAIVIRNNAGFAENLGIEKIINGTRTGLYGLVNGNPKILINWNGSTANIFMNGVKVISNTAFPAINLQFLSLAGLDVSKNIKNIMIFPFPLTDQQAIQLTTL